MKTIYLLLIALLVTTCDSDDTVDPASLLPPITTTGENTFGCLIDGKFFRPRDGSSTINSDNKGLRVVRTENDNLELHVYDRKSDRSGSLFIHLENFYTIGEGEYLIQNATGLRGIDGPNHNYIYGRLFKSNQYQTFLSDNVGVINISVVDTTTQGRRIFAGEFRATLANSNDTIQIELGRFDINSQTLSQTTFN
jgi:hypothetical protein